MRLKRSCQFTALAEMLTAGEEYVSEVLKNDIELIVGVHLDASAWARGSQ